MNKFWIFKKSKNTDKKGKRRKKALKEEGEKDRERKKVPSVSKTKIPTAWLPLCSLESRCVQLMDATQTSRQDHLHVGPEKKVVQVCPDKGHQKADIEIYIFIITILQKKDHKLLSSYIIKRWYAN